MLLQSTKLKRVSRKRKKNKAAVVNRKQKGLGDEGQHYPPPAKDVVSIACTKMKEWRAMKKYTDTQPYLNSAIPITSQEKSFDGFKFMAVKYFPGHKHLDEVAKNGLLWTKPVSTIGEVCLRYLKEVSDKLIGVTDKENIIKPSDHNNIAWTDILMPPGHDRS